MADAAKRAERVRGLGGEGGTFLIHVPTFVAWIRSKDATKARRLG